MIPELSLYVSSKLPCCQESTPTCTMYIINAMSIVYVTSRLVPMQCCGKCYYAGTNQRSGIEGHWHEVVVDRVLIKCKDV